MFLYAYIDLSIRIIELGFYFIVFLNKDNLEI